MIKVKTSEPLLKNSSEESSEIINMILKMAFETEEKKLNPELVKDAIKKLLTYPVYGHYFFIIDPRSEKLCGMNLVTFEHNINLNLNILWIQSVYVQEEYRRKGFFRQLLQKNEDYVLENKDFKKTVKLYMDMDNSKAEKVYFKVGFKVCKENLYELDYHFDNISDIKNNKNSEVSKNFDVKLLGIKNENLNVLNSDTGIFPENFYNFVVDVTKNENPEVFKLFGNNNEYNDIWEFESMINLNKINIREEKQKLMKVIENRNLGSVLLITNVSDLLYFYFLNLENIKK